MSYRRSPLSARAARWWLLCCLAIALPLCGLSTLLSATLGSVHFHKASVTAVTAAADSGPMAGWNDFRRANHVADSTIRLHDHSKLGRHHHDAADASLVTVGAGEHDEGVDGAAAAMGAIVLAASDAAAWRLPAPSAVSIAWARAAACRFQSCDPGRLDRPPIAV